MLTKLWPKVARGEEITLEEHKARNAAGLAALRTQWRASLIVAPSADAMPPWNILRIPACLNQQPSPKAHLRSGLRNLRDFLFLEIWNRAILFLRPPMTRIRRGQALPETHAACEQTPASRVVDRTRAAVADRRGRATERPRSDVAGRAGLLNVRLRERDGPDVGRAAPAEEGNFSSLQTLENKRNRIGIPPNPPRSEDANATAATIWPNRKSTAQGRPRPVRNRNDG